MAYNDLPTAASVIAHRLAASPERDAHVGAAVAELRRHHRAERRRLAWHALTTFALRHLPRARPVPTITVAGLARRARR
jgi:hypothetical protein